MKRKPSERRATYVVTAGANSDLTSLAPYLSSLGVAGCDVLILDESPLTRFDEHRRVLRWVGRHLAVTPGTDALLTAIDRTGSEKVIVASEDVRYSRAQLDEVLDLLEIHEVVEPHQYLDPMPWWCTIDAGRMLVHRGVESHPDHGATFAFRRSAVRGLRGLREASGDAPMRRLIGHGAEVHAAKDVFVQRQPPRFESWLAERPRQAMEDFALPAKTAFFFAIVPMLLAIALIGGGKVAGSCASVIAFASVMLAVRGRIGASEYFPLRSCLAAPLWIAERAVSVYWALGTKLVAATSEPAPLPAAEAKAGPQAAGTSVIGRP